MAISKEALELSKTLNIPGKLIAENEALVFEVQGKFGPEAWHVYQNLDLATILRYQELTQKVAARIDNTPGVIQTSDGLLQYQFTWKVIPIDHVTIHNNHTVAISKFIYGDTISEILLSRSTRHPLQQLENHEHGIVNRTFREFCRKLNTDLGTTNAWFTAVNTKPVSREIDVTDVSSSVQDLALAA